MVGVTYGTLYGGKRAEWGRSGMRFKVYVGESCVGWFDDYDHVLGFIDTLGSPEVTIEDTRKEGARLLLVQ